MPVPTFADLPLLEALVATLTRNDHTELTPIQGLALPGLLDRTSLALVAPTGSGKTLTYVLPVLDRLKRMELDGNAVQTPGEPRALVVVPTRELGDQVARVFKWLTHDTRLRVRSVLGGRKARQDKDAVASPFEVLVGTPGRIARLVGEGRLALDAVRIVVLDEADELLEPAFAQEVVALVQACPGQRQLVLATATWTEAVEAVAHEAFDDLVVVEAPGSHRPVDGLRRVRVPVPTGDRRTALARVLSTPAAGGTLLFANTREQVDTVAAWVVGTGRRCAVHRGELDPVARKQALQDFRTGMVDLLVCTDLGARGLDLAQVGRVINVHLPRTVQVWLHRAGRTARAGRAGEVIDLVTPRDARLMAAIDALQATGAPGPSEPTGGSRA